MKLKITNGPNIVPPREGRPSWPSYHPSRKARLRAGKQVGKKGKK